MNILLQCGDHFENQQRLLVLAKELKNMGHTPKVVLYTEPLGNLFKTQDIEVIYYYTYRNKNRKKFKVNINTLDFSSTVGFRKISDIIKVEGQRRPEIMWPSKVERTSEDAALHYYTTLDIILDTEPDIIGIWNGYTGLVANTLRLISEDLKIPSFFMERGIFKNSIFIDRLGCNGAASISKIDYRQSIKLFSKKDIDNTYNIFKEKTKCESNSLLNSDYSFLVGKKIVFFPLQVTRDTNILLYSEVISMRHAFYKIYEKMNNDDTYFIVRPHPEESKEQYINLPILDNVLVCSEESLDFWIENSDTVVTINSTVGLEALLKEKNVITLGQSIYSSFKYKQSLNDSYYNKFIINGITRKDYVDELKCYLMYLVGFNTLIKNSEYNKNVIESQIPWLDKTHYINSVDGEESKQIAITYLNNIENPIVNINFDTATKINLTYRTSKVPISKEWVSSIIDGFGARNAKIVMKSLEFSHLMICDEGCLFDGSKADIIIDIYGNILSIFGVSSL